MQTRFIFLAAQFWFWGQVLLLAAAPLRVTTLDLQPRAAAGTNGWSVKFQRALVQEAAESLKKSHPDVILLQHVADWQTCRQLAQDLQPDKYRVVTCSSWRDPLGKNVGGQVAILSKTPAYISWSEPWQTNGESASLGGFAFAAIRAGEKTVGVFSVQRGSDDMLQKTQLARQINSLQNWKVNRLQACLAAFDSITVADESHLEQLGFENALATLPLDKRAVPACLFTRDAGLIAPPLLAQTAHSEHDAITCELDLTAPKMVAIPPALTKATNLTDQLPTAAVRADTSTPASDHRIVLWLASCLAGVLALSLLIRKIFRRSELPISSAALLDLKAKTDPSLGNPLSGQITVTPPAARMDAEMRASLVASLSQWLKQKVMRQLVSDRAQLMATQQIAALKMQAVDERLAKVEQHIQQRNQDYERRIDELLKALLTAKEENRELIRAQITRLKAEIEKSDPNPGRRFN